MTFPILITAKSLDQLGLIFGFISGILLIPEIINWFNLEKLEEWIELNLDKLEKSIKEFPLKFYPPSWMHKYTEKERESVESITAIRTLIFSIIWISILIIGFLFSYNFLIVFVILILILIVIGNMRKHAPLLQQVSYTRKISFFFGLLFILIVITPVLSLIRVFMLVFRLIVNKIQKFFSTREVLRKSLTIFAIIAFIVSNILQFIATLL